MTEAAPPSASADYVTCEVREGIAWVMLNRPDYANTQNYRLLNRLDDVFKEVVENPEVRVIVLGGNGKHFSAGHDLGTPEYDRLMPRERKLELIELFAQDFRVLSEVGSKDAEEIFAPYQWVQWIKEEIAAGSWKVITEARESGTAGIFRTSGEVRSGLIDEIAFDEATDAAYAAGVDRIRVKAWLIALVMLIVARETASISRPTTNGSRMLLFLNCSTNFGGSTEK